MNRREFTLAAAARASAARAAGPPAAPKLGESLLPLLHDKTPPVVAMLLYPGMTLLDLLGPQTVLCTAAKIHLVWKKRETVVTDSGVGLLPSATFDECPKDLDVLFVGGGGPGPMRDKECVRFLADRGARAKYVTSVCTGSLVLGAAGLMRGYKATSHWAARDLLPLFGAEAAEGRVVTDRNRISGGGVTAGIDFGLVLLAKLLGEDVAKLTQLAMEYDPKPPFDAGTPKAAGPAAVKAFRERFGPAFAPFAKVCEEAAKAMPR